MINLALDKSVNKRELEYPWYGIWSKILEYWFEDTSICPQHKIFYEEKRCLITDFTVMRFSTEAWKDIKCKKGLIVEAKKIEKKNLEAHFDEAQKQLLEQVVAMDKEIDKESRKEIYGVISIGKYWRWYRYTSVIFPTNEVIGKSGLTALMKIGFRSEVLDLSNRSQMKDVEELARKVIKNLS